jgi:hypothetical protein
VPQTAILCYVPNSPNLTIKWRKRRNLSCPTFSYASMTSQRYKFVRILCRKSDVSISTLITRNPTPKCPQTDEISPATLSLTYRWHLNATILCKFCAILCRNSDISIFTLNTRNPTPSVPKPIKSLLPHFFNVWTMSQCHNFLVCFSKLAENSNPYG